MSTGAAEMIDLSARLAESDRFTTWLAENGQAPLDDDAQQFFFASRDPIYGPIVGANMNYFRDQDTEPRVALAAARTLCQLTLHSSALYSADHEDRRQGLNIRIDPEFQAEMQATQLATAEGIIRLISPRYAMTPAEGRSQVMLANRLLGQAPSEFQKRLAEANYSTYFSRQTMADAETVLNTTIEEALDATAPDQMPHLTRTNFAIAQLIGAFAKNKASDGRLVALDCGSGSGATLVAMISELNRISDYEGISLFGIEPNPRYQAGLRAFAPTIMERIQAINPGFELITSDQSIEIERRHTLSLVEADIVSVMKGLKLSAMGEKDVAIMTANYSWHRLPSVVKAKMIERIKTEAPNSIFLVGDLQRNSSKVNRHYFNFGNNGPLNAGNLSLRHQFESQGYQVIKLGEDRPFKSIHPALADTIVREADNDGHFWIAYRGAEAQRLIEAA